MPRRLRCLAPVLAAVATVAMASPHAVARNGAGESRIASHDGRTWVTGTYFAGPSGRLRVSVRSDARRVRVTYRTTGRRLRSKVVRIRNGLGLTTVPRRSQRLAARAFGTSRLRPSATVGLRRNPLLQDADGNGTIDQQYDLDSNGTYELVLFDDNLNGRFESLFFDAGTTAGVFKDQNEDGYFEFVGLDVGKDGLLERIYYDGNRDGYAEYQCLDLIGPDGAADTWVATNSVPTGSAQTETANELVTENIVTMNQLRQLNPWSTGYIPYSSTPSLLR